MNRTIVTCFKSDKVKATSIYFNSEKESELQARWKILIQNKKAEWATLALYPTGHQIGDSFFPV